MSDEALDLPAEGWLAESDVLRDILTGCGLDELIKWRKYCYATGGKNIAIIQEMKPHICLMFFKGALLDDPEGMLKRPGENSNAARRFEFTSVDAIVAARAVIECQVASAIEIEKAGRTVPKSNAPLALCEELLQAFERDPELERAFVALTPGRQRGYSLFFSAPKGSEARHRRIAKCRPKILAGKGYNER